MDQAANFAVPNPVTAPAYVWPTFDQPQPRYSHHQGWWFWTGWDTKVVTGTPWHVHSFTIDVWWKFHISLYSGVGNFANFAGVLFDKPGPNNGVHGELVVVGGNPCVWFWLNAAAN